MDGENGEDVFKFLEEELEAFEKLYQELIDRNRAILEKKEILIPVKKDIPIEILIIQKEKPKSLPKFGPIKVKPKTLPKPKLPSKTKIIPITYVDSEYGSEV